MSDHRTIDVHAHILSEETISLMGKEAPGLALRLTRIAEDFAVLDVAGRPYRPFPRGGWDMQRRFMDMAAAGIDVQLLSNTPQTFLYDQEAQLALAMCVLQNDQIAAAVAAAPDRLKGLATLPMQAPELAAAELRRAMATRRLHGAQIGSNVNGSNLDDPALEPLWAAADALGALIMVHPTRVAGADRLASYYLGNLIGNPLEVTIAAAALVFGGVVARFPRIRFLMVHGGGFLPYQVGRFNHGWQVRPEPRVQLTSPPAAYFATLYCDSIVHARPALEFLVSSRGAHRVLLGSDYPFDMGTLDCVRQVRALPIADAHKALILSGAAAGLTAPEA